MKYQQYLLFEGINNIPSNLFTSPTRFKTLDELVTILQSNITALIVIDRKTFSNADYLYINDIAYERNTSICFFYVTNKTPKREYIQRVDKDIIEIYSLTNSINKEKILCQSNTIIFSSHGEGSHLNLNDFILCSCQEKIENKTKCRKHRLGEIILVNELKCKNTVFLSCNSAIIRNELYPDNSNLLFSALDKMDYVIAALIPINVIPDYSKYIKASLQNGISFVNVTAGLNQIYKEKFSEAPFICCTQSELEEFQEKEISFITFPREAGKVLITCSEREETFQLKDKYISFQKSKNEIKFLNLKTNKNRLHYCQRYIEFFDDFFTYLESVSALQEEEIQLIYNIKESLKTKLMSLYIQLNYVERLGKIESEKSIRLIAVISNLEKGCRHLINLLIKKRLINEYFEQYISDVFKNEVILSTDLQCERCQSILTFRKVSSDIVKKCYHRYDCPICGVYSIKDSNFHVLNHSVNIVNNNAMFDITLEDSTVFFSLMNKATGKIWKEVEINENSGVDHICVDVEVMEPDVHSYKALLIEKGLLGYIHGKFIK